KATLQGRLMLMELRGYSRETVPFEGVPRFRRGRYGYCLSPCILSGIIRKQRCHSIGIFAHFFDRARKPFIDRAVHQSIREPEHEDDWQKRKQESSHHDPRAKLGSQNPQAALGEKLD